MKDKALQELRQAYRQLKTNPINTKVKRVRYDAIREFAIMVDILTFQEIETMETEQDDLIGRKE